jgi:malate dehydrogenase (oxaloacetate-decarboxylating)
MLNYLSEYGSSKVGPISKMIKSNQKFTKEFISNRNTVAVVSDGSAVLSYGNLGSKAVLPILDGKCSIMRSMGGINAIPISLNTQDPSQIIKTIEIISPGLSGIMIEDIAAPKCFTIEEKLSDLGIPVLHDDQHGIAIATYAALLNAAKVVDKSFESLRVCINGAGAAGNAIAKILGNFTNENNVKKIEDIIVCDSNGIIHSKRKGLRSDKIELASFTNPKNIVGSLAEAIDGCDVIIGVSKGGCIGPELVERMADRAIVFALANPIPEIHPKIAKLAGAKVAMTGQLNCSNSINNALVFPGMFRAAIDNGLEQFTIKMKYQAANSLAEMVSNPTTQFLLPNVSNPEVPLTISKTIGDNQLKTKQNGLETKHLLTKSTFIEYANNNLLLGSKGRREKYGSSVS